MHGTTAVRRWPQQDQTVVALVGEHDLATLPELRTALAGIAPSDDVVLDLTECTLIDAGVLGVIAALRSGCACAGGKLTGVGATGIVATALRITGFPELALHSAEGSAESPVELRVAS